MNPILNKCLFYLAAACLLSSGLAQAKVTFVGNDLNTDAKWRSPGVVKPNDLDGDNLYGSYGYFLAAGKRSGYVDPFLVGGNLITASADAINTLTNFSLWFTDPAQRGRSWGGQGGNFGTLDVVPQSTGLTGAAILRSPGSPEAMSLTLKRTNSPAIRLTLILGNNPNEGTFDDPSGQQITVDDGTGPVTEISGDPGLVKTAGYTTYQSWDITAGSSDITIVLEGLPLGSGVARLSGLAVDILAVNPPTILAQPVGGIYLTNIPLTLSVTAGGTKPVCQWFRNSNVIFGATSPTLTFPKLTLGDAGAYYVVASNAVGHATSEVAVVQVVTALPARVVNYETQVRKESSLISLYSFDDLTAADSKGPNPGTLQGPLGFGEGIGGGASHGLAFTGTGHVNLGEIEAFDFLSGTGTVEAWIKAGWVASPGYNPTLFAARDSSGVNYSIHLSIDKSQIALWNGNQVSWLNIPNAGTNWHLAAVVFDAGGWSVYWDGVLMASATLSIGANPLAPTQLGSSTPAGTEIWVGAMDEVAFFGRALTESDLRGHYQAYIAGDPPVITTQPVGGIYLVGGSCQLAVQATGPDLAYQWFHNNTAVPAGTRAGLSFTSLAATDAGSYYVKVSNPTATVQSDTVTVVVSNQLPAKLTRYQNAVRAESSLISSYSFDYGDARDFKGAHPGSLSGAVVMGVGVGGDPAKAAVVDGRSHVDLGVVEAFDFLDGLGTVEGWIRADWIASPGYNPTIVAARDGGPVNWSIHMMLAKNQIAYWNGSRVALVNIPDASTNWHHFAMTLAPSEDGTSTTWTVYWDGQLAGSDLQAFGTPGLPVQLGSSSVAGQERWIGALDEFAFYSTALSGASLQAHYTAFIAGDPPVITTQPAGGSFFVGEACRLSVNVRGADLAYQWFKNGTAIPKATNSALTFASLAAGDSGTYRVQVSNAAAQVDSSDAVVRVVTPALAKYQAAIRQEGSLISYYTFDNSDANDSKAANHGTVAGDATFAAGVGGAAQGLALPGTGMAGMGPVATFDFTSGLGTAECWLRADWDPSAPPAYNPCVFADRDGGPTRWSIHMMQAKNQIAFWNGSQVGIAPIPAAGTNWHMFASVFEGGAWKVYWDGQLAYTGSVPLGNGSGLPTQIGSSSSGAIAEGWVGTMDEVAFYSEALSAGTILAHYQALVGATAAAPQLTYNRSGNQLTLAWPAGIAGLMLESATNLTTSAWSKVAASANTNQVLVPITTGNSFFRLKKD